MTRTSHPCLRKQRARVAPAIEPLELRLLLTAVVVNTIADSTDAPPSTVVSLRDAINIANKSTTATTITFSPTVFATARTITLGGTDLALTGNKPVAITGPAAGVTINGNQKSGDFQIENGAATLSGMTITGGKDESGGGIEITGGTLTVTDCTISGNSAVFGGGGVSNPALVAMTLIDCTISGNSAGISGGGVANTGPATLTNCTISGNQGGGLFNSATATVTNCTISDNTAVAGSGSAGIFDDGSGFATVANTIVAGNSASLDPDVEGPFNSLGFNLIGKTDGSTGWSSTDLTGTAAKPLNPDLGPLANNGGPTQTLLPLAGSPAIAAGSVALIPKGVTTDQRGLPRVVAGAVDIGAVELQKDPSVIHANDLGGTYSGKAFSATGYVAGVGGASIATPVFTYYLAGDKALSNPLAGAPSSAGSYVFVATYAGSSRYLPTETSGKFTIARTPATIHAADLGGAYNGKAFPAIGYVAGIGGASIGTPLFTYYLASDTTFSDPLAGAPSAPGSYIFLATFTGSSNYLPTSTTARFTIVAAAP